VTEIRSYRRVFDLERRIYSVDRLRLNPAGVPVRGVIYLLVLVAAALLAARLPLLGAPARAIPWFVRDLALPAATAAALTVMRIDGRSFHHAARAAVAFWASPRRTVALSGRSGCGRTWCPPNLLFLSDGAEGNARRVGYSGPGAVLVLVAHHGGSSAGRRRSRWRRREVALIIVPRAAPRLRRGRLIEVGERARMLVAVDPRAARR